MIPLVAHPVHVRLPGDAKRPGVEALVRCLCPARLRERDADDFAPLARIPGPAAGVPFREILAGPDGPWEVLVDAAGAPIPAAAFLAYLCASDVAPAVRAACDAALSGTPVAAAGWDGETAFRGTAPDGAIPRSLVEDAQDRARHDLLAFLGSDVALVEGRVHLRARPVALVSPVGGRVLGLAPDASVPPLSAVPVLPGTFEATRASAGLDRGVPSPLSGWFSLSSAWPDDLDDLRWALNAWTGPLRRQLDAEVRGAGMAPHLREAMAEASAALRPVEARALTGRAGHPPAERGASAPGAARLDLAGCHAPVVAALDLLAVHGRIAGSAALAPLAWVHAGHLARRVPAEAGEAPRLSRSIP